MYLSWAFVKFCVCPFPFGIKGRLWDVIVIIPEHCLSFYFTNFLIFPENAIFLEPIDGYSLDLSG